MPVAPQSFDTLIAFDMTIGESPVWDAARQALWFVDILAPAIFRRDAGGAVARFDMPAAVGSIGLAQRGRLVVALRTGVYLFDPASGELAFLVHPEPDNTVNRLNDGKVGPDGCFWVGSMHDAVPRQPTGALYRVTPAGACTRVITGLNVSNGLAWSRDGRTLFHADSRGAFVKAYPFDPTSGAVGEERVLARFDEAMGLPDGAAVDAEGYYWSAGVTAGCLHRIAPEGGIVERIALPVPAPTMVCFGGPDLRTLYVTSLATNRVDPPAGGTLIAGCAAVAGVPVGTFGLPSRPKA